VRGLTAKTGTTQWRTPASSESIWTALAVCYLLGVGAFEVIRHAFAFPSPGDVAATPAAVAAGKVWLLLTSALLVSGQPILGVNDVAVDVLEFVGLVLAAAMVVSRFGGKAFWRAAIAGHVGGTLLVYAGLGLLWLSAHDAGSVVHKLDYGVSAVFMALLGALTVSAWQTLASSRRQRRELLLLTASAAGGIVGATLFSPVVDAEHGLAFALGALVSAFGPRPGSERARTVPR
jgi:hypothetical protein